MMQAVLYGVWPVIAVGCAVAALYHKIRVRAVNKFLDPGADLTRLKKIHRFASSGEPQHIPIKTHVNVVPSKAKISIN